MEITIKFLKIENPSRYINVTRVCKIFNCYFNNTAYCNLIVLFYKRKGQLVFGVNRLKLIKSYQITDNINNSSIQHQQSNSKSSTKPIWIQDAILLAESNRLCVSTSKRNLRFFNISSENFSEDFSIYDLPTNPFCLDYYFDVNIILSCLPITVIFYFNRLILKFENYSNELFSRLNQKSSDFVFA